MIISSNWMALKASGLTTQKPIRKEAAPERKHPSQSRKKSDNEKYVALDCEMVEGKSIEHMLARVSIVDFEGRVLYDAYVKPQEDVVDYRTSITGITKETLRRRGEPVKVVRSRVVEILKDKIVIGHAVHHDFEALDIPRPEDSNVRDTVTNSALRPPNRKQTPSLRLLSEYWLDKTVQEGSHSSIEDARTAMMLYKKFQDQWEASLI
jgi:RNA exonuclease 4